MQPMPTLVEEYKITKYKARMMFCDSEDVKGSGVQGSQHDQGRGHLNGKRGECGQA